MANIKDLSRRIASLRNMQKVTRAMDMIATIRLRKLFALQKPLERFSTAREQLVADFAASLAYTRHPLLAGYAVRKQAHAVLFTADKGLCGSHNNAVQRELSVYLVRQQQAGVAVAVTCLGSKGAHYCRRKDYAVYDQMEISDRVLDPARLRRMAFELYGRFAAGEVQEVSLFYNRFITTLQQQTVVLPILPLRVAGGDDGDTTPGGAAASFEPEASEFLSLAGPLCVYYALCEALHHSYLSEYAARMTAMENATRNSEDLIDRYVTLQNRARQSQITSEIIEVVSGKEALEE